MKVCHKISSNCSTCIFSRPYTNGRAIGIVLRPSVVCRRRLYGMYCGQTVRPTANVTIDSLYRKSYMRNRLVPK